MTKQKRMMPESVRAESILQNVTDTADTADTQKTPLLQTERAVLYADHWIAALMVGDYSAALKAARRCNAALQCATAAEISRANLGRVEEAQQLTEEYSWASQRKHTLSRGALAISGALLAWGLKLATLNVEVGLVAMGLGLVAFLHSLSTSALAASGKHISKTLDVADGAVATLHEGRTSQSTPQRVRVEHDNGENEHYSEALVEHVKSKNLERN